MPRVTTVHRPAILSTLAFALLLVTAALPSAQAGQTVAVTFVFDEVDAFDFSTAQTLDGADAAAQRNATDEDGDGNVSQAEADSLVEQIRAQLNQTQPPPWSLDGDDVASFALAGVEEEGMAGPANSTVPFTIRTAFAGAYDEVSGDAAELVFEIGGQSFPPGTTMTITAPPGRTVEPGGSLQNTTVEDDGRTATGEVAQAQGLSVTFVGQGAGDGGEGLPGPGTAAALAAVATGFLLFAAIRRRRS